MAMVDGATSGWVPLDQEVSLDMVGCYSQDYTLKTEVGFPIYGITFMTFFGWFWLCFYFPTGMWAFVFHYIGLYI